MSSAISSRDLCQGNIWDLALAAKVDTTSTQAPSFNKGSGKHMQTITLKNTISERSVEHGYLIHFLKLSSTYTYAYAVLKSIVPNYPYTCLFKTFNQVSHRGRYSQYSAFVPYRQVTVVVRRARWRHINRLDFSASPCPPKSLLSAPASRSS